MPNQAPTLPNPNPAQTTQAQGQTKKVLSFPASSYKYDLPASVSVPASNLSIASANTLNDIEIPPYGYLRSVRLKFTVSGGAGTAVAGVQDAPWNLINSITFLDSTSDPILSLSGFQLYLANKYGGYGFKDPSRLLSYSPIAATTGNFTFTLYLPLEFIQRMALGSLGNMNSTATYKINLITNPSTVIYSTAPTTLPTLTITMITQSWAKPPTTDLLGNALTTAPPLINTTQYWTSQVLSNLSGLTDAQIKRVGNYYRNIIMVSRNSSTGARQNVLPSGAALKLDNVVRTYLDVGLIQDRMQDVYGYHNAIDTPGGIDTGVFIVPLTNDLTNSAGDELRNLYIATLPSSYLVVNGTWSNTNLELVLNDIAPNGDMFTSQLL